MKINIIVKTNRREDRIEYIEAEDTYIIQTKEQNRDNRANLNLIDIISDYFNVSKNAVHIKSGLKSKRKTVEIEEEESR